MAGLHRVSNHSEVQFQLEFTNLFKIVIADDEELANSWFKNEINSGLTDIQIEWIKPELNEGEKGIVKVEIGLKDHSIIIE